MCDFSRLSKKMFDALTDIEAGRSVFVVARTPSDGGEASIQDVICEGTFNPRLALEHHCQRKGISIAGLICLPVILPPGLNAEDVRGFRPVRTKDAFWIEFTGGK